MKFELKNYKFFKIKLWLKKEFFLLYNINNFKNTIKDNQNYKKFELNYYKIPNNLTKIVLKKSIYKNYIGLINGHLIFIKSKKELNLHNLTNLSVGLTLIAVKLNNKIYPVLKFNNLTSMNYKKIGSNFLNTVNFLFKNTKYLKKIRNNVI